MNLTKAALSNPAAALVAVVLLLLLGGVSLSQLPVQLFPNIDDPIITVQADWRAASPREVEAELIEPIEEVLEGLAGVVEMNAKAAAGRASVTLTFELGSDMQQALIEVISRLNRLPALPRNVKPPTVHLGGAGGAAPLLSWFFLQRLAGNDADIESYLPLMDAQIEPLIESVAGVSGVELGSGGRYKERLIIEFDPYLTAQLGIELPKIVGLIGAANDSAGGFVEVGRRRYMLRLEGRYDLDELGQMVLEWRDGRPIYLRDIATIALEVPDDVGIFRQNGNPAIGFMVNRQPEANLLSTLAEVKRRVAELNSELLEPQGLRIVQSFDPSVFIYRAIQLVSGNLIIGVLLAVGGLWLFLRRWRATLIVAAAIPISLLTTFIVLKLTGRTLNVISLAGLAFAVGMVVDAAIVVLESIVRQRERGIGAEQAALEGANRVWGALLASTATTVIIFIPVLFLKEVEGQLFGDLAVTIAVAVTVSLLVAVTLVPLASQYGLAVAAGPDRFAPLWQRITARILQLTETPRQRLRLIALLTVVPVLLTVALLPERDYLPPVKRDAIDAVFRLPPGASQQSLRDDIVALLEQRLAPYMAGEKQPALKNYYILIYGQGGRLGVRARDQSRVAELQQLIADEIVNDIPDLQAFVRQDDLFGAFGAVRGIPMYIQGRDSEATSAAAMHAITVLEQVMPGAQVRPLAELVDADPELRLAPRDNRIHESGWSRAQLGLITRALGDGLYVGDYFDGEHQVDILLRSKSWATPDQFAQLPLQTPAAGVVPLSELVAIERAVGPNTIVRIDSRRTKIIEIVPPPAMTLEHALAILKNQVEPELGELLPVDGGIAYGGSADDLQRATATLGQNFLVALLVLLLLISALFRSLRDGLLVLLALPLAMVGSVVTLQLLNWISFQPLDLLTMIGFVILLGLVVNNAILLVHQTRQSERDGASRRAAVESALLLRLRPIFMSTLTSLFGMLPLLLMPGVGSVIYRGMAAVIVGGMSVSAIFTLLLLPALLRLGEPPATKPSLQ